MTNPVFAAGQIESTNKKDATTAAAKAIQEAEKRAREEKTARLRAAREATK